MCSSDLVKDLIDASDAYAGLVTDAIVPVPSEFADKRGRAECFERGWRRHVGFADLLYARRGEGAELLRAHLRQRFLGGRRFVKVLWK